MLANKCVSKCCYLILVVSFLLQSCQHQSRVMDVPQAENKHQKLNAATYNTQLGLAYLNQGEQARAKHKLLAALKQAPQSPVVNTAMAYYMEKTGELNQARLYYRKAMSFKPIVGATLNNYGAFLCRQGEFKQAERYFMQAVHDEHYEHTAGAYENAGLCSMANSNDTKAAFYFTKALKQDATRVQSLQELVKIHIKSGQVELALIDLQLYPESVENNRVLLTTAVSLAHQTGEARLEARYQHKLNTFSDNTGVQHEHIIDHG